MYLSVCTYNQVRGYKKRADGSTTSYFDREVDAATRALLDQQKAPKRIEPCDSSFNTAEGAASAWNAAGTTWEDKDVSKWAEGRLRELLGAAAVGYGWVD